MRDRSESQHELQDVDSVAGHLLKPGSGFAVRAGQRWELFSDALFVDLFPSARGAGECPSGCDGVGDAAGARWPIQCRDGYGTYCKGRYWSQSDRDVVDACLDKRAARPANRAGCDVPGGEAERLCCQGHDVAFCTVVFI